MTSVNSAVNVAMRRKGMPKNTPAFTWLLLGTTVRFNADARHHTRLVEVPTVRRLTPCTTALLSLWNDIKAKLVDSNNG